MAIDTTDTAPSVTVGEVDGRSASTGTRSWAGAVGLAVVALAAITWSKWWPYAHQVADIAGSHTFAKPSVLDSAGRAGDSPSWAGGWDYTVAYGKAVWKAYVAVLVIAAASSSFVPAAWLRRRLDGRTATASGAKGALLGAISLFCTACAAPLAVSLRRDGVRTPAVMAFLLAAPVLNPAVIAILALVGPWQWAAVRIVVGLALIAGVTAVLARSCEPAAREGALEASTASQGMTSPVRRFATRLVGMTLTLTPIYLVLTFVEGALRGVALPITGTTGIAVAVVAAVLLGTLIDIPTAGEIPVVLALAAAGAASGVIGALLVTLPAISLITVVMTGRAFGARTTVVAVSGVVLAGVVAAALLPVIS